MDCKKALSDPEVTSTEDAIQWLRKHRQIKAGKLAERVTDVGVVSICIGDEAASIVEINTETTFVARSDPCQELALHVANSAQSNGIVDINEFLKSPCGDVTVADVVTDAIGKLKENIKVKRLSIVNYDQNTETIGGYVHGGQVGTTASLVHVEHAAELDDVTKNEVKSLAKKLAMQVVASKPACVRPEDIPVEKSNKERDFLVEEARQSGRPENIIPKIVEGRMKKFYEEHCLMQQSFIMDDGKTVEQILKDFSAENTEVTVKSFLRFQCGEAETEF